MTITQNSNSAIVNWNTFSIGAGGVVNVVQPSAAAALLNRVTSNTPSTIAGQLNSNGQVFLVNPNGIAITSTGTVNTGSFAASTLSISDQNFLEGNFTFEGDGSSQKVSNAGQIKINTGGYAALIGGRVDNSGTIIAPLGKIGLGAAELVTMNLSGDSFLDVAIPSQLSGDDPLISNSGTLSSDGGYIQMTVAAANNLARNVINLSGTAEARNVSGVSGAIVLSGDGGNVTITGKVDTSTAPHTIQVIVPIPAARPSYRGGDITITGGAIKLADATIDASGDYGGGDIKIGGDFNGNGLVPTSATLDVDFLTSITADALVDGYGGTVVLWSNDLTTFDGRISARGAGEDGAGGFAEVSGKDRLIYRGFADLRAPGGDWGTLLLDPRNISIAASAQPGYSFNMTPTQVGTTLQTANLTLRTSDPTAVPGEAGDIRVFNPITWNASPTPTTLTLDANRDIQIDGPVSGTAISGINGALVLLAGRNIAIDGDLVLYEGINVNAGGDIDVNGDVTSYAETIMSAGGNIVVGNGGVEAYTDLLLDAGQSITVNDTLAANTGNIDLVAGANININANVNPYNGGDVTALAGGNIAVNGPVFGPASTPASSGLTYIDFRAGGDIVFSTLSASGPTITGSFTGYNIFVQAGGELRINPLSYLAAGSDGLVANVGRFTNLAGSAALSSAGGRYVVYSVNWANDTRNGLPGRNIYGQTIASAPPSSISDNAFVFRDRPTLTVTVGDLMRMYFERNPGQPTYSVAGLLFNDTFDDATDGSTFVTDVSPIQLAPGTYEGALRMLSLAASDMGYNLVVDPGAITVTPSPNAAPPAPFNPNGLPAQPYRSDPDLVALIEEPDDISEVAAIEVSPNAAEISLAAVERASERFGDAIAVCERELEENGDEGAYLTCTGDALEAYADELENPLIKLPPELKATITVIRQTAQRVRAAAASPNPQAAVREARAAVGELVNFVKQQTALVRAVDPETQALLQQQGQVMTQALQELDLQLVSAVEI